MKEEVKRWIKQAKRDLTTAKHSVKSKDYYAASFWAQQSVEKALKAYYLKTFSVLKKIHNLVILAKELNLPSELIEKCDKLNPIYMDTRYPDAAGTLPSIRYSYLFSLCDKIRQNDDDCRRTLACICEEFFLLYT